jgi:hypothetical protein
LQAGAPLLKLRALSCQEKIVRAKSVIKNEDMGKLTEIESLMAAEMDELERSYKK